ncbi:MAG: hypothetical protein PQJ59_17030 [Spirochaetales bacterium]|nr:hypothetical protein [Spirochaetales bacterium]
MDHEAERKLNLEIANTDASSWNKKIAVIPAESGEELTDEVREATDGESVEELGDGELNEECSLTAKNNSVKIDELSERMTNIEARLFDHGGDKGHISDTEEQFKALQKDLKEGLCAIKEDNKEGFKTIHKLIRQLDETYQHAVKEQNRKIDEYGDEILDLKETVHEHGICIENINKRHEDIDESKKGKGERRFSTWQQIGILVLGCLLTFLFTSLNEKNHDTVKDVVVNSEEVK